MNSSWIASTKYKRLPDGSSYLAIFLKPKTEVQPEPVDGWDRLTEDFRRIFQPEQEQAEGEPVAFLYGPKVPSWVPGLVAAGTGRRSVGLAFNRLVKGKYDYQRVEGRENVEQLKEMMS